MSEPTQIPRRADFSDRRPTPTACRKRRPEGAMPALSTETNPADVFVHRSVAERVHDRVRQDDKAGS
jgi:carbonic anhydrase